LGKIVSSLIKQSKNKNIKVRIATLSVLSALAQALQSQLDAHFDLILPVLEETVNEKSNSDPLLLSLKVLKSIFRGKVQNSNYHKQADRVQKILLGALNHDYSKVVASGL
jgi:hypothetical protein